VNATPNGSAYIFDLIAALGSNEIAGLKMTLDVFEGDITQDNSSFVQGLLDVIQPELNIAPVANAGSDTTISTDDISSTVIHGVVTDVDDDSLLCRWTEGTNVLLNWLPAGISGDCSLDVSTLPLGLRENTLTLEVDDGTVIVEDYMVLTIVQSNVPPVADAGADIIIREDEIDSTIIMGTVTDANPGDQLRCVWESDISQMGSIKDVGANGECPLNLCIFQRLTELC